VTPIEPASSQRSIRTIDYDESAIVEIAELFDAASYLASFQFRETPIQRLDVPSNIGHSPTVLTFWTGLRRVDVLADNVVVVFTNVATVDLVEGVEVLFRRLSGEYLIVAIGGKVIVRA
jgi:hypothetical protein